MTPIATDIDAVLQRAARMAGEYLQGLDDGRSPVARFLPPEQLASELSLSLPATGRPLEDLLVDMERVLHYSVRTGHRCFFNQLFGGHDPAALLGEWIAALINTSMYTYEAAPVATLMEQALIKRLGHLVGLEDGEGVFAPGGSISNLMAVLAARQHAFPHVKQEGLRPQDRPVMFLSEEAHYSLARAAAVIGLGLDGAIEVSTDAVGRMQPDALDRAVETAKREGRHPFLVAATAGTTVPGAFDPLGAIADVARRHGLWLHVDASYGGTVLLSRKHRHLVAGIERADSVTWNPHKMMGVPLTCSATLLREKGQLVATVGMNADYLFHGEDSGADSARWNLGDMSLQCGRRVDALKLWLSWQALGDEGYEQRVDRLFALAGWVRDEICTRKDFRLVREPQATNVCFRYRPPPGTTSEHQATVRIRERLVRSGRFLINYATLDGQATFRIVLSNPATTEQDLAALLDEIEVLGKEL